MFLSSVKVTPVFPLPGTICCPPLPSRQYSSSCSRRVSWDTGGIPARQLTLSLAWIGGSPWLGSRKLAVRFGLVSNRVLTFGFSVITWALLELTTSLRSLSLRVLRSGELKFTGCWLEVCSCS